VGSSESDLLLEGPGLDESADEFEAEEGNDEEESGEMGGDTLTPSDPTERSDKGDGAMGPRCVDK